MKLLKIVAIVASLMMTLIMISPTFALNGPLAQSLQYKFYAGQDALFTGLLNNEVDIMAWPLTYPEWTSVNSNHAITTAPYYDLGDYELPLTTTLLTPRSRLGRL